MPPDRFLRKQADLSTILPAVAGPAIGGFAGRAIGQRFNAENLGAMLGGITGGVTGQLLKENLETKAPVAVPPGAPYALDATSADIPTWALQGARLLKQGSHFSDLIGSDLAGVAWPAYEDIRNKQPPRQIAKSVAGSGLGTLGGGLAGHAVGGLIDKAVGHPVAGPLGVPLSTLMAGLGATIGNFHGNALAKR